MASCLDTPRMTDLIECLTLRLIPLLSPRDIFECPGDKKMEKSTFVDEELPGFDGDKDDPLCPSTSSPEHVPTFTLEVEPPQATTSSTAAVEASRVEGEIISKSGAPSHIQKAHRPQ
jgi:hypothetical protein